MSKDRDNRAEADGSAGEAQGETPDGGFLSRWARRKSAARTDPLPIPAEQAPPAAIAEPFDVSTLPAIETLGKDSDFTAFLRQGVPADLKNAALQKLWTSDPAIRDFVGLSEMSWDFNAAEPFHGYGALSPLARVAEMVRDIAEGPLAQMLEPAKDGDEPLRDGEAEQEKADSDQQESAGLPAPVAEISESAAQHQPDVIESDTPNVAAMGKRRHGSAIPR